MKLYTFRTAMGQVIVRQLLLLFSVAAFLACAPSLRAHAVKVSEVPGIATRAEERWMPLAMRSPLGPARSRVNF